MGSAMSSHAKGKSTKPAVGGHKSKNNAITLTHKNEEKRSNAAVDWDEAPEVASSTTEESDLESVISVDESDEEDSDDEEGEEFNERLAILADCRKLKFFAEAYLHPEAPVVNQDPFACARCYFDRPSAVETEDDIEEKCELKHVLADAAALKKLAGDYMHPERPVVCEDVTASARCFFGRPSAIEVEEEDERALVLAEAAALKKLAGDYMHPERPVGCEDATASARCFFDRPSEVVAEDEFERATVLAEAAALKKLAVDYLHPEKPVVCDDATAYARCFFGRPSAVATDEDEERAQVLAEAATLIAHLQLAAKRKASALLFLPRRLLSRNLQLTACILNALLSAMILLRLLDATLLVPQLSMWKRRMSVHRFWPKQLR
jgi:predicted ATPase